MTMQRRDLSPMPADIAAVGQQVLPPTNPYRVIGDHLADLLDDADFADLYATRGRHAISPALLAMVTLFQCLEDIPDREAAAQVVVRLDWKYALHRPLTDPGFDYSCLCYFRKRLLAHQREGQVFETVLATVRALGLLKKRGTQRTDSLAVLGAVRRLSALETVTETLRLAMRALAPTAWGQRELPASFQAQYLHLRPDYRLSAAEQAALFAQVGRDGAWVLDRLADAPLAVQEQEAVAVLRAVWDQRFERVDGDTRVRAHTVDCTALIVTPHDPGVRAGQKRGQAWRGEKVHVTETTEPAEPGEPTFITDVTTANASSGDGAALPQIRAQLARRDLLPEEQVVDSGYISGPQMARSQAAGVDLIGPPLADTSPQAFKIAAFTIDRAAQQARCPQGHLAVKWSERTERDGSRAVNIQFAAATCAVCPVRTQCTSGTSGRSLHLSEHYELLMARRAEAQTAAFRERMRARPAIEATLSELVRAHGLRRHRYRGEAKRVLENLLKGAACNLKRLVRALVARWEPDVATCALAGAPVVTPFLAA